MSSACDSRRAIETCSPPDYPLTRTRTASSMSPAQGRATRPSKSTERLPTVDLQQYWIGDSWGGRWPRGACLTIPTSVGVAIGPTAVTSERRLNPLFKVSLQLGNHQDPATSVQAELTCGKPLFVRCCRGPIISGVFSLS